MKKLIIISLMLVVNFATAQNKEKQEDQSETEILLGQSGTLLETQFNTIGKLKGIEVIVMKVKNLSSGVTKSAIRFEYDHHASYGIETKIGVLDNDEVDGLIKSMTTMVNNVFTTTRAVYTEVNFTSRSGFKAGSYFDVKKASSDSPTTKNEKFYVDTKESMFEGKTVNKDDKGTFIWKTVTTSTAAEPTGTWKGLIKLKKYDSNSQVFMNTEEFKAFLALVEQAKSKL